METLPFGLQETREPRLIFGTRFQLLTVFYFTKSLSFLGGKYWS
jgi:hypothetical protein